MINVPQILHHLNTCSSVRLVWEDIGGVYLQHRKYVTGLSFGSSKTHGSPHWFPDYCLWNEMWDIGCSSNYACLLQRFPNMIVVDFFLLELLAQVNFLMEVPLVVVTWQWGLSNSPVSPLPCFCCLPQVKVCFILVFLCFIILALCFFFLFPLPSLWIHYIWGNKKQITAEHTPFLLPLSLYRLPSEVVTQI